MENWIYDMPWVFVFAFVACLFFGVGAIGMLVLPGLIAVADALYEMHNSSAKRRYGPELV